MKRVTEVNYMEIMKVATEWKLKINQVLQKATCEPSIYTNSITELSMRRANLPRCI
jgi:hypothetical protein